MRIPRPTVAALYDVLIHLFGVDPAHEFAVLGADDFDRVVLALFCRFLPDEVRAMGIAATRPNNAMEHVDGSGTSCTKKPGVRTSVGASV
jgi:hypothetical protein